MTKINDSIFFVNQRISLIVILSVITFYCALVANSVQASVVSATGCAVVVTEQSDNTYFVQNTLSSVGQGGGSYYDFSTYTEIDSGRCNRIAEVAGYKLGTIVESITVFESRMSGTEITSFPAAFILESFSGTMGPEGPVPGGYMVGQAFEPIAIQQVDDIDDEEHVRKLQLNVIHLLEQVLLLLRMR